MQPISYTTLSLLSLAFSPIVYATQCQPTRGGIFSPSSKAVITLGQPFNLTYCTTAYFKTSTIDIDVGVYQCGEKVGDACTEFAGGEELIHALGKNDTCGYETELVIDRINGSPRSGQWAIGVLEHTTGYYTKGEIVSKFVPVTFAEA